jgi:hypothetical protein
MVQFLFERPVVPWVRKSLTGVFARLGLD